MAIHELKGRIGQLPEQPGVYVFGDAAGRTLYVGKARALRDRVRSYLGAAGQSPRLDALLAEAAQLDVVVTDSVVEALALENNLIKQRSPRYNILLRDDKNYPYLQLTTGEAVPRVLVARGVARDGHVYAGPFLPARFARRTLALTHRLFGIRSCNETITGRRARPCLEYDIKRCLAPCVESICSPAEYARAVERTRLFLEGRATELADRLRTEMVEAASAEQFERAAQLRDALRTVETLEDRHQKMATAALDDRDVFGARLGPAGAVVQAFQVRGGRVVERIELATEHGEAPVAGEGELLQATLQQFYELHAVPPEILVPVALDEPEAIEAWLTGRAGRRVRLVVPQRGDKRGLVELAARNAALAYQARFEAEAAGPGEALATLAAALALPVRPRRIEAFDISTIQGRETVASMVVCEDGRMRRPEYRTFRIRGAATDDFAAMREVVERRYRAVVERGGPFPDLILIDGGHGQLAAAYDALASLGLSNLVAIGLAKKEELIVTRDRGEALALAREAPALHLLQRIRDEAHRVAVGFHRRSRTARDLHSALDEVPGIGPRRRRALLERFGSVAGVRRASREDLERVVGRRGAASVLAHFAQP